MKLDNYYYLKITGYWSHEIPLEGQRIYRPKLYVYNENDEVNSPNILSNIKSKAC